MPPLQRGMKHLQFSLLQRQFSLNRSSHPRARFIPASLENVEDVESYRIGGLHPISIGNSFANKRYRVLHKLGHGGSSTVWLARDQKGIKPGRLVTLKALRADCSSACSPELTVPLTLQAASPPVYGAQTTDDHFFVEGPNGSHLFLISPFAGPRMALVLSSLQRNHGHKRFPTRLARKLVKQLVMTVNGMHRAGIVHGDITTANTLFRLKPHVLDWTDSHIYAILGEPKTEKVTTRDGTPLPPGAPSHLVEPIDNTLTGLWFLEESIILADYGQSYFVNSRPEDYKPGTLPNYYPPEMRFEGVASFEADVWMLGCAIFEIYAGVPLFSSFFGSDSEILEQTVQILGRFPDPWWQKLKIRTLWDDAKRNNAQDYERATVDPTSHSSIREELYSKYSDSDGEQLSDEDVDMLADLLEKMLKYHPEDRIGLCGVLQHPWLTK